MSELSGRGRRRVVAAWSRRKLDYLIAYELARRAQLPFCPLPAHVSAEVGCRHLAFAGLDVHLLRESDSVFLPAQRTLEADLDDIELCFLTSGTTGGKKLVLLSPQNVAAALDAILRRLGYSGNDRVLNFLPLSFDYGFYQYLLAKAADASLILVDSGFSIRTASLIDTTRASVLPIVPTMLAGLLPLLGTRISGNSLGKLTSTGEVFSDGLESRIAGLLPGCSLYPMYGLTECKRVSIRTPSCQPKLAGSVGRPIDCCAVTIEGPDTRGIGEIVVRGSNVAVGYIEDRDGAPFLHRFHGSLFTGDYGWIDELGFLYVEGRRDDQIKLAGHRATIREIENSIYSCPGVLAVRVAVTNQDCTAHCIAEAKATIATIRRHLAAVLGPPADHIQILLECSIATNGNYKIRRD